MNDTRPDPDRLLERIKQEDAQAHRGKLKIFFGASAGVGKTYAMLSAARGMQQQGVDVVIGIVETHGRAETEAMVVGLERLPLADIAYRDRTLKEFDLDGALKRKPRLILVDELAHSNAAGSRHPKRWQDVEELLDAGLDVWSTMNVQHLESLNDVVSGITGIRVWETVPDRIFDETDEVVIVDLPPDELLQRLKEGKVYLPQQAERAVRNFFRKGNLIALRELALRRTADRVDDEMLLYRRNLTLAPVWQTREALLLCIGLDERSDKLVRGTARLAAQLDVPWHCIYVETPQLRGVTEAVRQRALKVLKLAQDAGATTATPTGHTLATTIVKYAHDHNLSRVVLGRDTGRLPRPWRKTLATAVGAQGSDLDVIQIALPARENAPRATATSKVDEATAASKRDWMPYVWSVVICAAVSLATAPLHAVLELANIVMVFLLAVVIVAVRFGRGPAVLAAFLSVGAFDFFYVPPRFSLNVSDAQYLLTFGVMLVVALVIGQMTAGLKFQARVATLREERVSALYEMSRDLSGALMPEQVAEIAARFLQSEFEARAGLMVADLQDRVSAPLPVPSMPGVPPIKSLADPAMPAGPSIKSPAAAAMPAGPSIKSPAAAAMPAATSIKSPLPPGEGEGEGSGPPHVDTSVAQWAFDHAEAAGYGTDTLPGSPVLYLPLKAPMRLRGVLAIEPKNPARLAGPEQRRLLDTCASLLAISLERIHYVDVAQGTTVQMESERLRNSLLAAISHDLRTPLAALIGMAESLSMTRPPPTDTQREIVVGIGEAAQRMNSLVNNLLDMARLQAGPVQLNRQWQPLEEVIGSSLKAMSGTLDPKRVRVTLPDDLPLVHIDAVLIERVLCNLLENAGKYTPPHSPIEISATTSTDRVILMVDDHGPGLPKGREEAIFEKFERGRKESATSGVGLGLAICLAIVQAHGGTVRGQTRAEGGARFTIELPRGTPPSMDGVEEIDEAINHHE